MKLFKLTICAFILVSSISVFAQTEWNLAKNKNNIKVYTRKLPNAKLKDYKAVMELNATVNQVIDVILDFENYKNWFASTATCYLLEKRGENELYQYYEAKAPWPVDNRDVITQFIIEKIDNGIRLNQKGIPDFIPKKDGIVRIPNFEGYWEVTDIGAGKVKVVQFAASNPGGSIPAWLANTAVVDTPFESFSNLKKRFQN